MSDNQYRRSLTDSFPLEMKIEFGDQVLVYRKEFFSLPDESGNLVQNGLRYGENPDQPAALYRLVNGHLNLAGIEYVGPDCALVSGLGDAAAGNMMYGCRKHPSKTNLTDVDSALGVLRYLTDSPAAVIVKHNNPSGVASVSNLGQAFELAYKGDRVAAFGGAVVVNRALDRITAEQMAEKYLEVVAAPEFEDGALDILGKKPDVRVFKIKNIDKLSNFQVSKYLDFKSLLDGGIIVQQSSVNTILGSKDFKPARIEHGGVVYEAARPSEAQLKDMVFGWAVEQGVISNSVLFVRDGATISIAGGQQDRVGVVMLAISKAFRNERENLVVERFGLNQHHELSEEQVRELEDAVAETSGGLKGAVMVSDAFFPFRDAVDLALEQRIGAVVHPGGSLRDWESIEAVNEVTPRVPMVFTGHRAFKH